MRIVRIVACVLLLGMTQACASPSPGSSAVTASTVGDELRRRFSAEEVSAILRDEGYGTVEILDEENIRFKAGGMSYVLTIYEDGDLQLYFGLTGIAVTSEVVNEWNRTKRLSRAYLDDDHDPVLEADLLSDAGMTRPMLVRWVQVFVQGAGLYHTFLLENGTLDPVPARQSPASI